MGRFSWRLRMRHMSAALPSRREAGKMRPLSFASVSLQRIGQSQWTEMCYVYITLATPSAVEWCSQGHRIFFFVAVRLPPFHLSIFAGNVLLCFMHSYLCEHIFPLDAIVDVAYTAVAKRMGRCRGAVLQQTRGTTRMIGKNVPWSTFAPYIIHIG